MKRTIAALGLATVLALTGCGNGAVDDELNEEPAVPGQEEPMPEEELEEEPEEELEEELEEDE